MRGQEPCPAARALANNRLVETRAYVGGRGRWLASDETIA